MPTPLKCFYDVLAPFKNYLRFLLQFVARENNYRRAFEKLSAWLQGSTLAPHGNVVSHHQGLRHLGASNPGWETLI